MSQTQYRAWLVDLDGTLYRGRGVKLAMAAELVLFGLGRISILRRFRKEHEVLRENPSLCEASPFDTQISRTADALSLERSIVEATVQEWMVRRPGRWLKRYRRDDLVKEIRDFVSSGGKAAVVSDYPASYKLSALELSDLFSLVVANGENGGPSKLKPSPEGYLQAARLLGVEACDCLVIGDRDDADGAAAKAAGMAYRRV
jgi:HAD superfamily hydrolase (TIGR01549 family)